VSTRPAPPPIPSSFGPSALATPANAVTLTRLLISPFLLAMIVRSGDSWPAVTLWIALCVTDGLDGYLARKHGTTRSGAFLDPLADKVLVLGAAIALVSADRIAVVPVAIILVREVGISAFRGYWGRRGLAVPATGLAKVKTVTQEIAIGWAILPWTAHNDWLINGFLWAAVVLTVWTGAQYIHDGSRSTRTMLR
jgi:CDP-diacylglycerol--glycerol-3-phosphate 3-phosphatidyltransferase